MPKHYTIGWVDIKISIFVPLFSTNAFTQNS
jgi:hypothetical protein